MEILEGKAIAEKILSDVSQQAKLYNRPPGLAAVLVGDNEASRMYVALKKKAAHKVGIFFSDYVLPQEATQSMVEEVVEHLNGDEDVDGILVQLPLPKHIDTTYILSLIKPEKDVDGLTVENTKRQKESTVSFVCPFPQAILELIFSKVSDLSEKNIYAIGNSKEFIENITFLLEKEGGKVEWCLYAQEGLNRKRIQKADIIISAVGKALPLEENEIKDEAILIDGGIEKDENGVIRGDFDQKIFKKRDITLSPVPGGVGPVTVACLMRNVLQASKNHA